MGTTVPESIILCRAMSVILRVVELPDSLHTRSFALNLFSYWMGHPQARIVNDEVAQFMDIAHWQCENQDELDAFGYIFNLGVLEFCPGKNFP